MEKQIYILATDTCYGIWCSIDEVKSYEKIYKIKKRSFDKPLAIMVEDYNWLKENTDLTEAQVDFLKSYPHPFTIMTQCSAIEALLQFDEDKHFYKNKDVYKQIAFRVAHTPQQKKLIHRLGPIFLTSANISWQKEIFNYKDLKSSFEEYEHLIHIVSKENLEWKLPSSDIFEFDWESLDIHFIRKNS